LLRFRKKDSGASFSELKAATEKDGTGDPILEAMDQLPEVKTLVSDVFVFRSKMAREDASGKSPESRCPYLTQYSRRTLIISRDFSRIL
jgi:hypothetical protein